MRILRIGYFFSILVISYSSHSQILDKNINDINAIIKYDETTIEFKSATDFELIRLYEIQILRRFDENNSTVTIYYDEFSSVKNAKVEVYNSNKERINKFNLNDFNDIAIGGGIASDSRAKQLRITNRIYPFYIKVSYHLKNVGSLHTPIWRPQNRENLYISKANFKIKNYSGIQINYKSANVTMLDSVRTEEYDQYEWQINDIQPYKKELFSYGYEYSPVVYTSLDQFEIDEFKGSMKSWNEFGHFISKLNYGKNNLREEQRIEIRKIANSNASDFEKVRSTYSYLQNSTRYVSIQLGIGGWAPFDASFVHDKKYGDCKALSFYTKAALEELGINSYYTLIRARANAKPLLEDFPNAYFNHAILTVPLEKDTIWLECTSQTNPFGYLGTFTSNRKALLINDEGGHLIQTKKYEPFENTQKTNVIMTLNNDGTALTKLNRELTGLEIENHDFLNMLNFTESDKEEWFSDWEWGEISLKNFKIHELENGVVPKSGYSMDFTMLNAAVANNKRLFINSSIFTQIDYLILPNEKRIAPIEIRYPYVQTDSIKIKTPEGFVLESGLDEINLSNQFGSYHHSMKKNDDEYLIIREFQLNDGKYDSNSYEIFREFINNVQSSDNKRIAFKKSN